MSGSSRRSLPLVVIYLDIRELRTCRLLGRTRISLTRELSKSNFSISTQVS